MLDAVLQDVRYALRALRSSPGFAAVAIVSLALGIGANTAIFTLIDSVILKTLPVAHPEQLLQVTLVDDNSFTNPIGLIAAIGTTRFVASFLYGMKANDPWTLAVAAGFLALVAEIAGLLPARRASRLEPMNALREEQPAVTWRGHSCLPGRDSSRPSSGRAFAGARSAEMSLGAADTSVCATSCGLRGFLGALKTAGTSSGVQSLGAAD